MRVVEKLNALDERVGVGRPTVTKGWEQGVRLWWAGPALAVVLILGLSAVAYASGVVMGVWMALPFLPVTFWGGFLYNERLRSLGRRPTLVRVPPSWPNETP